MRTETHFACGHERTPDNTVPVRKYYKDRFVGVFQKCRTCKRAFDRRTYKQRLKRRAAKQ